MVEKRYTQEEQEQYEAVVDEIAEFGMQGGTSEQVKKLIQQVESQNIVNDDLKERLNRDVLRKIDEMQQKAQNDQEKKVLEEYEGYVKSVDGKYRPTGVDQKFKVHVRPEASWGVSDLKEHGYEGKTTALYAKGMWWKMGNIFDRTFGTTVDADSFHKIIEDAEVANEQVEVLMRELALLKAAQKSITDLMGMTAAGFMTRVRSRGITSIVGASLDSTGDFFGGMSDKYFGKDRKRLKQVSVTIAKKTMEMKEKQAVRDAALKKMEELRGSGRELFDKAFKPEVDVLLDQKDKMRPTEYEKKVKELRAKVEKWGQKTGFVHMSIFLDESMGVAERGEEEFLSDVEIKQRRALVSRFVLDCTGKAPAPNEVQELMDGLKANQPDVLNAIYAGKTDKTVRMVLEILYRGEYGDIKLVESRRATFDTTGFMRNIVYAREYAKVGQAKLEEVFKTFVEEWQGVSANEFDSKFDLILRGRKPNEEESRNPEAKEKDSDKIKFIKDLWRESTDETISEKMTNDLYEALQKDAEFKDNYQKVFKTDSVKRDLLKVIFSGQFKKKEWVSSRKKLLTPTVANFIGALHLVDGWIEDVTDDKKALRRVITIYSKDSRYKGMDFTKLTKELFNKLWIESKRKPNKRRSEKVKRGAKSRNEPIDAEFTEDAETTVTAGPVSTPPPKTVSQLPLKGTKTSDEETIKENKPGYQILAKALGFSSDAGIDRAKKLYKELFEGKPELEELLRTNLEKVRFFITGKFRGLEFDSNKMKRSDEAIKALVKILPILDTINISELEKRIKRYFSAAQVAAQGAEAMLNFIKSLK